MADEPRVTYEMLYELVRREKSREELQKLDETYLGALLAFLREQDGRMLDTGNKNDLFSMSERDSLQVQAQNTRRLVRELYERRERKMVDLALNKSRTNSDLIDTSNLLAEEKVLFDMLVTSLDAFRRGVLSNLLTLKEPEKALLGTLVRDTSPHAVNMSSGVPSSAEFSSQIATQHASVPTPMAKAAPVDEPLGIEDAPEVPSGKPGICRVRFTQPVEQFVGQELELYGPFQPGEEAELPSTVADVLLAQQSAVETK